MAGSLLKKSLEIPASHDPANAFTCWVQEKNFDETALLILSKCGQVAMPKFAVQHKRWLGYFMDAGNNAMGIFQSDEKARWRQLSSSSRRFSKPPKGMN